MIHSIQILKFDNKSVVPRSTGTCIAIASSLSAIDFAR